jgi:hypothetical protein
MNRNYPLLRLNPDQAGKLQHDFNRLQANHTELKAQLAALEQAMRDLYGSQAFLALRNHARNQAQAALLKQEIAA